MTGNPWIHLLNSGYRAVMGATSASVSETIHAGEGPQVRRWRSGDLDRLVASAAFYSADTCSRRFFTGQTGLPSYYIAGLRRRQPEGDGWLAQVAIDRGRVVAVAECAWDPARSEPPDLAVMVADAWQRRGLGRRTLAGLVRRCRDEGLTTFGAEFLDYNPGVRSLAVSVAGEMSPGWSVEVVPAVGTHRLILSYVPAPGPR
jgi:GNAT superfamily N-acetyltransferase